MERSPQVKVLEDQIRKCYVLTHKTHEKCAALLSNGNNNLNVWQIFLSVITTAGISLYVLLGSKHLAIFAVVLSVITMLLTIYAKMINLSGISKQHAEATSSIWNAREKYLSLLTDIRAGVIGVNEIRIAREKLQFELHKTYKGSPKTLIKAYDDASRAIKEMEKLPTCNEEIDKFFPDFLKNNPPSALSDQEINEFLPDSFGLAPEGFVEKRRPSSSDTNTYDGRKTHIRRSIDKNINPLKNNKDL
ncbi:MAG: SLATT domain-containing protein [Methylococcales bacterium]|nr:SLATT domain-containing protein [Methylococcales bacterium]